MIGVVAGLLLKTGLPERLARAGAWVVLIGLAALGLWWLRHDAHGDGVRAERAKWEQLVAAERAKRAAAQREADRLRAIAEAADREEIIRGREEVRDAVRDIPDSATSDRQRTRACLELRRQDPAAWRSHPACNPAPPGG